MILRTDDEFVVVRGDTPELVAAAYRLRYQVYCVERGFESGRDGIETDEFDAQAWHVLLIHRATGKVVGTARVVPCLQSGHRAELPMAAACEPSLMRHLPSLSSGEISRFAISKERRMGGAWSALARLCLMQGILAASEELGLTHWCAIMEPVLLRLLQADGIHFVPIGPLTEYHGIRQPTFGTIQSMLERTQRERRDVWDFITRSGTLWHEARPQGCVAA